MMNQPPRSTDEKLKDLARALEDHDRNNLVAPEHPRPEKQPRLVVGPKTKTVLRIMGWTLAIFWLLWLGLVFLIKPPHSITELLVIPFSAAIIWLIYQFNKVILVWIVQKASAGR